MFWIPVMFVAACVLLVRSMVYQSIDSKQKADMEKWEKRNSSFRSSTEPDRELLWMASETDNNPDEKKRIVREFMAENDKDWEVFAMSGFGPAKMILLAKHGKLPPLGYDITPPYLYSKKQHKWMISPRWKIFVMTEKFLLRIEDTLRAHGVNATLVANYGLNSPNYVFYPVGQYVEKYGYGRDGYVNFSTRFSWSAYAMNVQPIPEE